MWRPITIGVTVVRKDRSGLYCLNDLHKASGGERKHEPGGWLRNDSTKEIIAFLEDEQNQILAKRKTDTQNCVSNENQVLTVIKGGEDSEQGTFVCKELVYSYAMWVSAAFHIQVIRTYDKVINQEIQRLKQNVVTHAWAEERLNNVIEMNIQLRTDELEAAHKIEVETLKDVIVRLASRKK